MNRLTLDEPLREQAGRLTLPDGRRIAFAEAGDPEGAPFLHCHGHPGSRLEVSIAHQAARRAGIRLIGIDRPGMGRSDFEPRRHLAAWPGDAARVADALELEQFGVLGPSGGGPYALASLHALPDRVRSCGVLAGLGPIDPLGTRGMMPANRLQFRLAGLAPGLVRPLLYLALGRHRRALDDGGKLERVVEGFARALPESRRRPEVARLYVEETLEAFRQGSRGAAFDAYLFTRPWGFPLDALAPDRVVLWHGTQDVHVPVAMARFVAAAVPGCDARFFDGEDHLDVIFGRLEDVMASLRRHWDRQGPTTTSGPSL